MNLETAHFKIQYFKKKVISKSELARATKYSREYIRQLLKNGKDLSDDKIKKLEEYFQVDLSKEIALTTEEQNHLNKSQEILSKFMINLTDSELTLLAECLIDEEKKPLLMIFLNKLKTNSQSVKNILL